MAFTSGTALLRRGRWRASALLLGLAAKLAPDQWESHNNLAAAFLKLERWEDAAKVAERAVDLDPTAVDSRDFLGLALMQLERWEEAVSAYEAAVAARPDRYDLFDRLGIALLHLERWHEAAGSYESALKLDASLSPAHKRLGIALQQLRRWDDAATSFRHAIELADPTASTELAWLHVQLARAMAERNPSTAELTAVFLQRAASLDPDAAAPLRCALELLKREQWDAALAELAALRIDVGGLHFLRVDPLIRLGREAEGAAAFRQAVAAGGEMPGLPGLSAAERIARRRNTFWTAQNLGADVFAVERWLDELSGVPKQAETARAPRLLFVLDNDFGELATVKFFVLGQELASRSTLLLPERLFAHNVDAVPGRTHRYASVDDVIQAVDREQAEIVFLVSGYLFCAHLGFTPAELADLMTKLRKRDCRVLTADPFLGLLSKQDLRTTIRFEAPTDHVQKLAAVTTIPEAVDELTRSLRNVEEQAFAAFAHSERILRETYHLYPSHCEPAEHDVAETDDRNVAFFNDRLIRPARVTDGTIKSHWLFVLATPDCEIQGRSGEGAFADVVASKLIETLAAGRHPILIGPSAFVEKLVARMPTAEGIDILSHCPFNQFYSLLLSAEHVFYWNVVSHSLLIRLYNQLPIVQFDRGHLVRTTPAIYDRIVRWYYQGWEPPIRDHHETLTLETVEQWASEYRKEASRLAQRYRRAPSPQELIADLMSRSPVPDMKPSVSQSSAPRASSPEPYEISR